MKKRWDKVDATVRTFCYLHVSRKRQAGLANLQLKALKNLLHYQNCTNFVPAFKHSEKRVLKSQSIIKHVSMQYVILSETLNN